jgi:hypothetical protein
MIESARTQWLATAMGLVLASLGCAQVAIEKGQLYGYEVISLDNGLVRLSVTPAIGGRVLELKMHGNAGGVANVRMDNIHRQPDDPDWPGADYGGFSDAATSGWPGPFWAVRYDLQTTRDPDSGAVTLTATGQNASQKIVRRMTVRPESTAVEFSMEQTNTLDQPQQLTLRLHSELAAGDKADGQDVIILPVDDQIETMAYIVGAEYNRFRWINLSEPWAAVVDRVAEEGVARRFISDSTEPPRLFFWAGYNESPEMLGDRGAFFSLDWFAEQASVAAGQSLRASEQMMLFRGTRRLAFFNGDIAGGITTDRSTYGRDDDVTINAALVGATERSAARVELDVRRDEQSLAQLAQAIPASPAGRAGSAQLIWHIGQLTDGPVTLQARFIDRHGRQLGRDQVQVRIVGELVKDARNAFEALNNKAQSLRQRARKAGFDERLDVSTELAVLRLRLNEADQLLQTGDYHQALEAISRGDREADALAARLGELD